MRSRRLARQRRLEVARAAAASAIAAALEGQQKPPQVLYFGEVDEATARYRRLAAYDALPDAVRQAMLESTWDLHIGRRIQPFMDCTALIASIKGVQSEDEAIAFNEAHAARGFGRFR